MMLAHKDAIGCTVDYAAGRNRYMGYLISLALQFAKVRGEISDETYKNMIAELQTIPGKIAKILEDKERIQWFASKQANAHDVFFVGRGIDYISGMESDHGNRSSIKQ